MHIPVIQKYSESGDLRQGHNAVAIVEIQSIVAQPIVQQ